MMAKQPIDEKPTPTEANDPIGDKLALYLKEVRRILKIEEDNEQNKSFVKNPVAYAENLDYKQLKQVSSNEFANTLNEARQLGLDIDCILMQLPSTVDVDNNIYERKREKMLALSDSLRTYTDSLAKEMETRVLFLEEITRTNTAKEDKLKNVGEQIEQLEAMKTAYEKELNSLRNTKETAEQKEQKEKVKNFREKRKLLKENKELLQDYIERNQEYIKTRAQVLFPRNKNLLEYIYEKVDKWDESDPANTLIYNLERFAESKYSKKIRTELKGFVDELKKIKEDEYEKKRTQ